ncbi:MAG TPA: Uma2 family endonuclease [Pyrinomonadaceae bacterium]|nr:Uma2 family endonuclease [Pyrinomonadaceae bacterium]
MMNEVIQHESQQRTLRRKASIEEFWALPESVLPTEYINGEIIMAPTPTVTHQTVLRNIFRAVDGFVQRNVLGNVLFSPLDIVLPTSEVVQPDLFFFTTKEWEQIGSPKRIQGVPSLAMEILSPGSVKHDTITKRKLYEQNKVREYWIVGPEAVTIAQLVLRGEHYELTELAESDLIKSEVLTDFEMNVGELIGQQ